MLKCEIDTKYKNYMSYQDRDPRQINRQDTEFTRPPEILRSGVAAITVVVPSLDETTNILSVRDNLRVQRKNLSPNIGLRLVVSDNGSGPDTLEAYRQILSDEELQRDEEKIDIATVYGSKKGFNSSARSEGLKNAVNTFHRSNPDMTPQNHVILSFDADTVFERPDALQTLATSTFANPNTMVTFGPIKFRSSTGKVSTDFEAVQRPFNSLLLGYLFRLNGKDIKDYINPPHQVFHGIFTGIREAALLENPDNILINYKPTDRAGVDVRMSLLLQRHLEESQIAFDKRLSVYTQARGYETRNGNISRAKFMKKTFNLFFGTHYVPYALQRELETMPEDERHAIAQSLRFADVIGSFARDVDKEVYGLEDNEELLGVTSPRQAQLMEQRGFKVVRARNLKTGEPLHNRTAVIGQRNDEQSGRKNSLLPASQTVFQNNQVSN
jgi:hypothetical protein